MQSVVFAWLVTLLLREPAERVGLAQMSILLPGMLFILLAGAIADRAKQENFGTIVMGRRGRSSVRDFFVGRVTNKVIHMARDRTVWVVR